MTRHLGLEGRLAADNIGRNPQRTATTSNALLIGVFLVTLVAVAGSSLKDFAVSQIDELAATDLYLLSEGGTIDDELIANVDAVDGIDKGFPCATKWWLSGATTSRRRPLAAASRFRRCRTHDGQLR